MLKENDIYKMMKNPYVIVTGALIFLIVIYFIYILMKRREERKKRDQENAKRVAVTLKEGYRDPLYMNRYKLMYDYYPRSNGSIYGRPLKYGGNWHMFSGYPLYDTVY